MFTELVLCHFCKYTLIQNTAICGLGVKNSIIITPKTSKCSKNENTALLYNDKHKIVPVSNGWLQP